MSLNFLLAEVVIVDGFPRSFVLIHIKINKEIEIGEIHDPGDRQSASIVDAGFLKFGCKRISTLFALSECVRNPEYFFAVWENIGEH